MVFDSFTFYGQRQINYHAQHCGIYLQPELPQQDLAFTYQNIVWLDVSMQDVASFQQLEGQEELLTVGAHSLDVEPNIFTIFLQHLSQIHTKDDNTTGKP